MLRQCRCCCCCAIIAVFSLYVAFLKFNSIDAGCGGSKETEAQPQRPHRNKWSKYCGATAPNNENGCNTHTIRPCILMGNQCKAAIINVATYLKHNVIWVEFCQNIGQNGCAQTEIKPCRWHTYTSEKSACIAKPSDQIFVRVPQA
ncbi:hypothetical protein niasHT_003024 [Heterodera trifolii]|uniref:Secreted protein n=1 Tax=Heterodera trifolii TaxID=157864 RepID=A0ABD2M5E0_9BILA